MKNIKNIVLLIFCFAFIIQAMPYDNFENKLNVEKLDHKIFLKGYNESRFELLVDFEVMKQLGITNLKEYIKICNEVSSYLKEHKELQHVLPYEFDILKQ